MEEMPQFRQQPAPQAPARTKVSTGHLRGPRRLCLTRGENGFGFTLRHFLVYPPESYRLCADARVAANPDEPMETIFVKNVPDGTSAKAAGLATGDRILSVNGEMIEGKSYATVVQMIQNTPDRLVLMVVPKEDDVIQQYYSQTAHHPKTNPRPRLRSPEVGGSRRDSSSSPAGPRSLPAEPIYHSPIWTDRPSKSSPQWHHNTCGGNWSSTPRRLSDAREPVISPPPPSAHLMNNAGCRLSLDGSRLSSSGGSIKSFESNSTLMDDSLILSRIRRSCEQKEEFLRSHVKPVFPPFRNGRDATVEGQETEVIAREFYARPQRMAQPTWPPEEPGRTPLRPLPRIHEGSPIETSSRVGFGGNSFDSDPGEITCNTEKTVRSRSEEKEVTVRRSLNPPLIHLVSHRAKQFESGQLEEDRTYLYKSELARLTGKRAVPNVAVRRQEFEQRSSQERSLRSPDSTPSSPQLSTGVISGNRTVLVGSKHIHVAPPDDYYDFAAGTVNGVEERRPRVRSSSTERWSSLDEDQPQYRTGALSPPTDRRQTQSQQLVDSLAPPTDKQRHKAVRQDSYLAAVKTIPGPTAARARRVVRRQPSLDSADLEKVTVASDMNRCQRGKTRATRPRKLALRPPSPLVLSDDHSSDAETEVPVNTVPITMMADNVVRRVKTSSLSVDERTTRRVSYLKATGLDRVGDPDQEVAVPPKSAGRKWLYPMLPGEIQRLRRIFEEYSGYAGFVSHVAGVESSDKKEDVIREGMLHCKLRTTDGKRATDRSWKQLQAVLRGSMLILQKDKRDAEADTVDLRGCQVDVPGDYRKRNNVLRLRTAADSEYFLQAEDANDMEQWRTALEEQTKTDDVQKPRSRSPTGQSPVSKWRKASQPAGASVPDQIPSPKSKTWKGKLGKPFRRMQGGAASPSSPTYPEGASIGVPLELCPPSLDNPHVPLLVTRCTTVVESRGLDIVGVYRVPGNKAAIAALTDAINKGIHTVPAEDPRWNDVNVISSLLKSFFRNLPDPLFTAELYPQFIAADKRSDPKIRMASIRKLLKDLPQHHYDTLKHVLYHLKNVVANSLVNKMESKNLAIVFGPTLVRAPELLTMVQDTAHQCRIIESLITHVDWFFSEDDVDCLEQTMLPPPTEIAQGSENSSSATLLLNNLSKVSGYRGDHSPSRDISRKDIMSSIISAANRMSKSKPKKPDKLEPAYGTTPKVVLEGHSEMAAASSIATSILSGAAMSARAEPGPQLPGVHAHDAATLERIRRFEVETQAMLNRDPTLLRRTPGRRIVETQRLQTYDSHITSTDLNVGNEASLTRKVGSCESLHEDGTNLKRFKSSREDCSGLKFGSLDSLQAAAQSDDGHDLLESLTETFNQKLQVLKSNEEHLLNKISKLSAINGDMSGVEKAEMETAIGKEMKQCGDEEKDKDSVEEKEKEELKEKEDIGEDRRPVLRPRPWNDNPRVKRSESLNKTEKPDVGLKVRRSESLGKADVRRTDSLTKTEKTETNMKAKLKRSSSKEKENSAARLKRIKRRHTVGGTKDLDKLPWLDNRLYTEALERQAAGKQTRTSSPDLSSPKLRNSLANELISFDIHEDSIKATAPHVMASPSARPQSMPPPLESHI